MCYCSFERRLVDVTKTCEDAGWRRIEWVYDDQGVRTETSKVILRAV